ncbi:discoidin domain-containing protein [Chitinophaga sp. 212800010-3]|uniref:discoidin domain-containing protein n=1 Tax=unclassified Chitinophaga TaxID=2619133 RepID=UPI002DED4D2F|nr:DUF1735 domain-containing protein [Chitinophaga sp. 212800010-3]
MYRNIYIQLLGLLLLVMACKKNDRYQDEQLAPVKVAISSTNGQIVVPGAGNYIKSNEKITIPVKMALSASTPKIFTVSIGVNNDTVSKLIAAGKLPNAVLLEQRYYQLPRTAEIRFGLDTLSFNLDVAMQAIEKNYGKDLALAVSLGNPGKNNTLDNTNSSAVVVIHTDKVIAPGEIHYVYFTDAGNISYQPSGDNAILGTSDVTIPISVSLGGVAGSAFTAGLMGAPDTVQQLLNKGAIPGGVAFTGDDYTLPATVNFDPNANVATFPLKVKAASLQKNATAKPVLAISLNEPSDHLLDSTKRTVVIVLDPAKLIETDITNTNIRYTVQFENTSNGNENSSKLIDNNINTKFLLFNFTNVWAQLDFATPQFTGAYTMTSANDAPGRDPKNWEIQGSNNGVDWVVLDSRNNESFPSRFQTKKYTFDNKQAFKSYRLNITANWGDGLFQLAEWRLLRRP